MSRRNPSWLALVTGMLLATTLAHAAGPPAYVLDPVHTRVLFLVDHAGFSRAVGTVSGSTGTLRFDPADWTTASLQAEVPLARLDLGDERWNRATLARNLLDAESHPVARFVSTRIEPLAADRALVHGTLELRGVSRDVVLDVTLNALGRYPLPPFRRTVGFSATTTLDRSDFGMTAWKSVIGDRIELRIEAEATRTRTRGETDEADTAPEPGATAPADEDPDAASTPEPPPDPEARP